MGVAQEGCTWPRLYSYTLDDAVALAKLQAQACKFKRRGELETDTEAIQSWEANEWAETDLSVHADLPNLDVLGIADLTPLPSMRGTFARVDPAGIQTSAARLMSWGYALNKANNLGTAVDDAWEASNARAMQSKGGPPPASAETTRCFKVGVCVCTADGAMLWNFKNGVFKRMKAALPWSSDAGARKLCAEGFVVLGFEPWVPHEAGVEPPHEVAIEESICMQAGRIYCSPYRPTFQMLKRAKGPAGEPAEN